MNERNWDNDFFYYTFLLDLPSIYVLWAKNEAAFMGRNGLCSGIHSEGNLPTQLNLIWKLGIMNERRQLIIAQSGQSVRQGGRQIPVRVKIKVHGQESLQIKHEQTQASSSGDLRSSEIFCETCSVMLRCWRFNFSKLKILCLNITWRGQLTDLSRVSSEQHSWRNIKDEEYYLFYAF